MKLYNLKIGILKKRKNKKAKAKKKNEQAKKLKTQAKKKKHRMMERVDGRLGRTKDYIVTIYYIIMIFVGTIILLMVFN